MITAFKDIEKIIKQTEQPQEQITELDFSSVKIFRFTEKIKTLVEKCQNLTILKLCECQLNSLDKLPNLDITSLDVSINKLRDCDLQHLSKYKNLSILIMSDNFITTLSSIKALKECSKLKDLELGGNQIDKLPNYRQQIFKQLKGLELLDKLNQNGQPPACIEHSDDVISQGGHDQDQDDDSQEDQEDDSQQFQEDSDNSQDYETQRKYKKNYQSDESS